MPLTTMLKIALRHPSYGLLIAGFFVCGFHVAFILAHFPAYLKDVGISANIAALCIALIGLFNIAGSYGAGVLADRIPKKAVLAGIYLGRSIAIIALLILPKTPVVALSFAAMMGVLWLSTVPPTSGLVSCMFGTQYVATLYGIVFLSHQIGAFVGIWTGGWVQTHWGSYDAIWWVSIALGVVAAALHLAIKEHAYHASE
jgi:predicted MFS family arabinose efflux permease